MYVTHLRNTNIGRPLRPIRNTLCVVARVAYKDDEGLNKRRKKNIDKLNKLFFEESITLSGDELSMIIYARFGKTYKPEITTRMGSKFLVLIKDDESFQTDFLHFNKIAEINSFY